MPDGLDERGAPLHGREQPRFAPGRQHLAGMPVERHRDRAHPALASGVHRSRDHRAVAPMHAVEEPDGDDRRRLVQGEPLEPFDDPHGTSVSRTAAPGSSGRCTARAAGVTVGRCDGSGPRGGGRLLVPAPAVGRVRRGGGPPVTSVLDDDADHGRFVQLPRERGAGRDLRPGARGPRVPGRSPVRRGSSRAPDPRLATGPGGAGARVRGQPARVLRRNGHPATRATHHQRWRPRSRRAVSRP